ncbi:hypothetical protein LT85_4396 [Collimonas arenae]|uniref:Uncharacterized protein n=1 Tax=Collimonas arenae TaxID=279058 RepID=A0A0A1FIS4_9BURK|nr:hypothetical protein LT85_4396 [Collimonas arenae]
MLLPCFQNSSHVALQQTSSGKFCFNLLPAPALNADAAFYPSEEIFNP